MDGADVLDMEVFERACNGLFLTFQYPKEIAGVSMINFLLGAYNSQMQARDESFRPLKPFKFKRMIAPLLEDLHVDKSFLERYVNHGFSGGEKKKSEVLQLKLFKPKYALLDETDSGLDVDALKIVSEEINDVKKLEWELLLSLIIRGFLIMLNRILYMCSKMGKLCSREVQSSLKN